MQRQAQLITEHELHQIFRATPHAFRELEKAGLKHKQIAEVRCLLGAPAPQQR